MDRLLPPIKSRPISFKLPTLRTVSDALSAITAIIEGGVWTGPSSSIIRAFLKSMMALETALAFGEAEPIRDAAGVCTEIQADLRAELENSPQHLHVDCTKTQLEVWRNGGSAPK
jgi:hypothetical protein